MSNVLKYKGYHGTVEYSAEDGMLIGSVIGIRDSLNYHGSSITEITESFHTCIDEYLDMCKRYGRSPDKEYRGSFNIRITPELHRDAAVAAEAAGISLNQFVQEAIEAKAHPPRYCNSVYLNSYVTNGMYTTPSPVIGISRYQDPITIS